MSARFKDYLREAFNARPLGMFVPPNWLGLAAFGMLGVLNPGFWLLGAGLEWAYLQFLVSSPRFRKYVASLDHQGNLRDWEEKVGQRTARLPAEDLQRYQALEKRCRAILDRPQTEASQSSQAASLGKLLWIYLSLLQTRQALAQILAGSTSSPAGKIRQIESQIKGETDETLRRSLESQLEILRQRVSTQQQGRDKMEFLESELSRIEEQVELIREQTLLGTDPGGIARRIDEVTATLGGTTEWMREQQQVTGEIQDILDEPPPIPLQTS